MDGSNVSQLITEDIIDPRGLAIDHEGSIKIYNIISLISLSFEYHSLS